MAETFGIEGGDAELVAVGVSIVHTVEGSVAVGPFTADRLSEALDRVVIVGEVFDIEELAQIQAAHPEITWSEED